MNKQSNGNVYFGFAISDSMFEGDVRIERRVLDAEGVKKLIARGVISCCNVSHQATITAMSVRFGIEIEIPETPPHVTLKNGDSLVILGVRGLPRMVNRHEYTDEEIAQATFSFSRYIVGYDFEELRAEFGGPGWSA